MTNISVPSLLPCPFCGEPPYRKDSKNNPWAACHTKDCQGSRMPVINLDEPHSIERWNTRAQPAAQVTEEVLTGIASVHHQMGMVCLTYKTSEQTHAAVKAFRVALLATSQDQA